MSFYIYSAGELLRRVGERARQRRLGMKLRQTDLAIATGATISTIRRFEAGENVGLEVIVRISIALECADEFATLFAPLEARRLDELLAPPRRRVRKAKG